MPQAPQLAGSLARDTQVPPQLTWPEGHAHCPLTHVVPPAQVLPHAPQFAPSLCVSMHAPAHETSPVPQVVVQVPALQTRPVPQALPQPPQFCASLASATQVPRHAISFAGQTHAPLLQIIPPPH